MTLTNLVKILFADSRFTSINELAVNTRQTFPFVAAFLSGEKESAKKADIVFDALTKDISAEELLAAIKLIRIVRIKQTEKEQMLRAR